jgi:hypothetical protein
MKTSTKKSANRKAKSVSKKSPRKWSARVARTSDALDLEANVFEKRDPHAIATSLKHSAEHSKRKKAGPFQSAMSMLNFYINRAGKNLSAAEKSKLEKAKDELRRVFHKEPKKK